MKVLTETELIKINGERNYNSSRTQFGNPSLTWENQRMVSIFSRRNTPLFMIDRLD